KEVMDEIEKGPVLDAALIAAAQKVEHYEIASYGTLCTLAKQLGQDEALRLLKETMAAEKATDEKLTMIAESETNQEAAAKSARRGRPSHLPRLHRHTWARETFGHRCRAQ